MKKLFYIIILLLAAGCTSQKKLSYLNNLSVNDTETFEMKIPEYRIQPRDILYISAKGITADGSIKDFLSDNNVGINLSQGEAGGALLGYNVNSEGFISLVPVGEIKVSGLTIEETTAKLRELLQKVFVNAIVECKLLSFKYTVFGEVKNPGSYMNYNNYLTVIEAIGRAGGVGDLGNRNNILVIRPVDKGTETFRLNLQDKNILTSEGYFLLPNDVVIVEPLKQKIFNMNLPIFSSILTGLATTFLIISYIGK